MIVGRRCGSGRWESSRQSSSDTYPNQEIGELVRYLAGIAKVGISITWDDLSDLSLVGGPRGGLTGILFTIEIPISETSIET